MTPICSVLVPTRRRRALLATVIESFLDTAASPDRVEILVRVHEDDQSTMEWVTWPRAKQVRVMIGDTEDGYGSIYKFLSCLAVMANGDWIWMGSDDTVMLTQGWDRILEECLGAQKAVDTCRMVTPLIVNCPQSTIPILSRGYYHALGHVGVCPHEDCYIDTLAHFAGIKSKVAIQTKNDNPEWTAARDIKKTWARYRSAETARLFEMDKRKLSAVLGRKITEKWTPLDAPEEP